MRDILGFIQHASSSRPQDAGSMLNKLRQLLRSYWQLIPALICLIILSIPIRKKIKAYQQNPSSKHEQKKALKDIAERLRHRDLLSPCRPLHRAVADSR